MAEASDDRFVSGITFSDLSDFFTEMAFSDECPACHKAALLPLAALPGRNVPHLVALDPDSSDISSGKVIDCFAIHCPSCGYHRLHFLDAVRRWKARRAKR